MFDEHNIPKTTNSGIGRIVETGFVDETISFIEESKRRILIKEILEGKFQK